MLGLWPPSLAPLVFALLIAACNPADTPQAADAGAPQTRAAVNFPDTWLYSAQDPPVSAEHAIVVTTDRYASEIGAAIMERGGNAVDAAIAVSM